MPFQRMGAAFDHLGPAATLVQQMKYGRQPYLAKGGAAFLAVQLHALRWPMPDVIVPVPISWIRFLERGYNQSFELAKELSKLLDAPAENALARRCGGYSQAGLTRHLRLQLDSSIFFLRRGACLQDKVVLLIDDVATTGTTLISCAEALLEQCPRAVYVLTLCKAIR